MKFRPEVGYEITLNMLYNLGLPIRDKNMEQASVQAAKSRSSCQQSEQVPTSRPTTYSSIISSSHGYHLEKPSQFNQELGVADSSQIPSSVPITLQSASTTGMPNLVARDPTSDLRTHNSDGHLEPTDTALNDNNRTLIRPEHGDPEQGNDMITVRRSLFQPTPDGSQRPASSPVPLTSLSLDSLSQLLPPKRQLPFPKPKAKPKAKNTPSVYSELHENKRTKTMSSDILARPGEVDLRSTTTPSERTPLKALGSKKSEFPSSTGVPSSSLPPIDSDPMDGDYNPPQLLVGPRSNATQNPRFVLTTPSQESDDRLSENPIPLDRGIAKNWADNVDRFILESRAKPMPSTAPGATSNATSSIVAALRPVPESRSAAEARPPMLPYSTLAEYVALPEAERRVGLNQVLMELIMDDNFVTLCEDVEASWRRIGLER